MTKGMTAPDFCAGFSEKALNCGTGRLPGPIVTIWRRALQAAEAAGKEIPLFTA